MIGNEDPIALQKITSCVPVLIKNNMIVSFEKEAENNSKETIYNSDGFHQDVSNKNSFDIQGFDRIGFNIDGFNRKKEIFDNEEKMVSYASERLRKIHIQY